MWRACIVIVFDYQLGLLFELRFIEILIICLYIDKCSRTGNMGIRVDTAKSINVVISSMRPPSWCLR
jgi:hypothetical protein